MYFSELICRQFVTICSVATEFDLKTQTEEKDGNLSTLNGKHILLKLSRKSSDEGMLAVSPQN